MTVVCLSLMFECMQRCCVGCLCTNSWYATFVLVCAWIWRCYLCCYEDAISPVSKYTLLQWRCQLYIRLLSLWNVWNGAALRTCPMYCPNTLQCMQRCWFCVCRVTNRAYVCIGVWLILFETVIYWQYYEVIHSPWCVIQMYYYNGDAGCVSIFIQCMQRCHVGRVRTESTFVLVCCWVLNLKMLLLVFDKVRMRS